MDLVKEESDSDNESYTLFPLGGYQTSPIIQEEDSMQTNSPIQENKTDDELWCFRVIREEFKDELTLEDFSALTWQEELSSLKEYYIDTDCDTTPQVVSHTNPCSSTSNVTTTFTTATTTTPSTTSSATSNGEVKHERRRRKNASAHKHPKEAKCEICGKVTSRGNIARHMRIHTGDKPYSCTVCHKKFTQKRHLCSHSMTHTGEKPFKCELCNSKFTQKGNLRIHKRQHAGEKPLKCPVCHEEFVKKRKLIFHIRAHRGGRK